MTQPSISTLTGATKSAHYRSMAHRPCGAWVVFIPQGCTLPTDQLFNLEIQFESVFNLEFQFQWG